MQYLLLFKSEGVGVEKIYIDLKATTVHLVNIQHAYKHI